MAARDVRHGRWLKATALLLHFCLLAACSPGTLQVARPAHAGPHAGPQRGSPQIVSVEIVARYPHDPRAFTQGLLVHQGQLYETTGLEGRSELRRIELSTGRVLASARFPAREFGEGLASWNDELIGLTWTSGVAHRWRLSDFTSVGSYRYEGEGWGLTADTSHLIQSNGSSTLVFRDPQDFSAQRRLWVTAGGEPVDRLNELEYIDGRIWANVWMTPWIAVIDPSDGHVTHMIDLSPLIREAAARDMDAVANGIAWDAANRRLFVTGKLWPILFEIRVPQLQVNRLQQP